MSVPGTPRTLEARYFDAMYEAEPDPWGFENRWYERRKYAISLAQLPAPRYRSGFEPGCSIGVLTELLARRCDRLLSCDVAAAAVQVAQQRTRDLSQVLVEQREIPRRWPEGQFDLIVFSEMLYYFGDQDLEQILDQAVRALQPGGDPARRALAASGSRLSQVRRRRAPGARRPPRAGPAGQPHRAGLPGRCLYPCRWRARLGGPGDGPGVIAAAGVVVPAHNEEMLLPACLLALRRAVRQVSVPVHVLVAADSCTDRTAAMARASGALVVRIGARSVGAARAAGMTELLRRTAGLDPASIWPGHHRRRHRGAARLAGPPDRVRGPGLGRRAGHGHRGRTGASIRTTCRPRSRPVMAQVMGRTRTSTERTSASALRPTGPRVASGRCPPPRTTHCWRRSRTSAVRSCALPTSRLRPQRAGRRARRGASATCCRTCPRPSSNPEAWSVPPPVQPAAGSPLPIRPQDPIGTKPSPGFAGRLRAAPG